MLEIIIPEKELNFKSLEQNFYKKYCEMSCEAMKELLQMLDHKLQKERNKAVYRHKGHKETTIKTLMGEVTFSRTIYQVADGSSKKKFVYLLDEYLNFETIGLISTNLAEKIVENATTTSYRKTAKNVSELTGQTISHSGAWNIIQKLGKKVSDIEDEQVSLYRQNKLKSKGETKVLFEEADGVYIKMQGKDRKISKSKEMRVAISYTGWEKISKNRYELSNKQVTCGFEKVVDFANKKDAKIASLYDPDEIDFRIFNSDGATWLKKLHYSDETYFQLDKFHVKQAILRANGDKDIQKNITKLYENEEIDEMFKVILAYAESVESEKEKAKLTELYTYLKNNEAGLIKYQSRISKLPTPPDGLEYRNLGTCEHNVDLVVARRMKNNGTSWSSVGASNLAKLIALKASGELSKTLEKISKIVLPEAATRDIITILSAGRVQKTVGKGFESKTASVLSNNKKLHNLLDFRDFSDIKFQ